MKGAQSTKNRQSINISTSEVLIEVKMSTTGWMEVSSPRDKQCDQKMMKERAKATQAETLDWHKKRWGQRHLNPLLPSRPCPAFSALAVMEDGDSVHVYNNQSFSEDYALLLFLPMEGKVDKEELEAFNVELDQLASLGCQVRKFNQTINNIEAILIT